MIFCQPTKADLQKPPPLGIKNFSWLRVGLFAFYGLYFRNRYYRCLRELFLCGLADDPVTCGGEEETALFIGVHIASDVVIVIAGCVMNFTPVVIVVSAVFVDNLGFRLFLPA